MIVPTQVFARKREINRNKTHMALMDERKAHIATTKKPVTKYGGREGMKRQTLKKRLLQGKFRWV